MQPRKARTTRKHESALLPAGSLGHEGGSRWPMVFVLACGLVALPLIAAHVPARVKLLGLYPAAVGMAAGFALLYSRPRLAVSNRLVRLLAVAVVPLVLCLFALESYRAWRSEYREMFTAHLLSQPGGRGILEDLNAGTTPDDPVMAELLAPYREHLNPPVGWYLDDRLSGWPWELSSRMEMIFTAIELFLAVVAGAGIVFWNTRKNRERREAISP